MDKLYIKNSKSKVLAAWTTAELHSSLDSWSLHQPLKAKSLDEAWSIQQVDRTSVWSVFRTYSFDEQNINTIIGICCEWIWSPLYCEWI